MIYLLHQVYTRKGKQFAEFASRARIKRIYDTSATTPPPAGLGHGRHIYLCYGGMLLKDLPLAQFLARDRAGNLILRYRVSLCYWLD